MFDWAPMAGDMDREPPPPPPPAEEGPEGEGAGRRGDRPGWGAGGVPGPPPLWPPGVLRPWQSSSPETGPEEPPPPPLEEPPPLSSCTDKNNSYYLTYITVAHRLRKKILRNNSFQQRGTSRKTNNFNASFHTTVRIQARAQDTARIGSIQFLVPLEIAIPTTLLRECLQPKSAK